MDSSESAGSQSKSRQHLCSNFDDIFANKEASEILCDAMRCRLEDGDVGAEDWKDSDGRELAPDRFWNSSMESMIAADNAGPCLGIKLNIWERANLNVDIHFNDILK